MSYSDIFLYRRSYKIPTVVFLVVVSLMSFFLVRIFTSKPRPSQATKQTIRQQTVVNLSHNQAGIFWQTEKKATGWIIYGDKQSKLDKVVFDEKDTVAAQNSYLNHYVLIKKIKENQVYFFKIISDNQLVADVGNQPFSLKTPANIVASTNISPAYGKVISANGNPLSTGVVTLSFKNSYPLLGLIKLSGEWLIPLNNVVDETTQKIRQLETGEIGTVEIFDEEGQKSSVEVSEENFSPLPQSIIIGQNYRFTSKDNVLAATDQSQAKKRPIEIIFPKEDGLIPGESPLIKGTAIPGAEVTVIINSETTISTRIRADNDGVWRLVPKQKLLAGKHTLTVITTDSDGKEVKLTRQFTIAKSGEQVLGDATPEPTLTTAPTSSPSPTIPTSTAPTAVPTIYKTGFNSVPFIITSSSLIVIGLGIILAF